MMVMYYWAKPNMGNFLCIKQSVGRNRTTYLYETGVSPMTMLKVVRSSPTAVRKSQTDKLKSTELFGFLNKNLDLQLNRMMMYPLKRRLTTLIIMYELTTIFLSVDHICSSSNLFVELCVVLMNIDWLVITHIL